MSYIDKMMSPLVGGRVDDAGVVRDKGFEDGVPMIRIVNNGKTYVVFIMSDPEGNDIGWPEIQEYDE